MMTETACPSFCSKTAIFCFFFLRTLSSCGFKNRNLPNCWIIWQTLLQRFTVINSEVLLICTLARAVAQAAGEVLPEVAKGNWKNG